MDIVKSNELSSPFMTQPPERASRYPSHAVQVHPAPRPSAVTHGTVPWPAHVADESIPSASGNSRLPRQSGVATGSVTGLGSRHDVRAFQSQASGLRNSAKSKFQSANVALKTASVHLTAAVKNSRNGRSLLGLHYFMSAGGNLMAAASSTMAACADLAMSRRQDQIGKQLRQAARYFQLGGSPLAGLGRSLRDVDTALTTLSDPQKTPYQKQRDLAFAVSSILSNAGITTNAWSALTGNPHAFVTKLGALLLNSGSALRGIQNLQRNAQGLSEALEQRNARNIASYGAGVIYGLGESMSGFGRAVAQSLKESGYSQAANALMDMSMRAQNVGTIASNAQILINTLWPTG
ncbi:hypothetical protein DWU98_18820 [Dyella monticola]|uniref:Uncharacterized protein n=1 Tax=Dyella monticola TaxID=1927958 RepID=A0A370WT60_9GAMM|nr:hypothetical protein [Dyella monticola]RDS79206.1 hypothetical protein DWU98_18820 [Dyella monticola]